MEFAKEEGEPSPVQWGFNVKESTLQTFSKNIEFVLLHEFQGDKGDFFDWHIDTKPGDGTGRTVNINVMLSEVLRPPCLRIQTQSSVISILCAPGTWLPLF